MGSHVAANLGRNERRTSRRMTSAATSFQNKLWGGRKDAAAFQLFKTKSEKSFEGGEDETWAFVSSAYEKTNVSSSRSGGWRGGFPSWGQREHRNRSPASPAEGRRQPTCAVLLPARGRQPAGLCAACRGFMPAAGSLRIWLPVLWVP